MFKVQSSKLDVSALIPPLKSLSRLGGREGDVTLFKFRISSSKPTLFAKFN